MHEILLRVALDETHFLGPGKVRLLELIDETGSIAAAARLMDMSYRRAWLLIDDLNTAFGTPLLASVAGGRQGGGASLTDIGREVVTRYRRMEARAQRAIDADAAALRARIRTGRGRKAASKGTRVNTRSSGQR